MRPLSLNDEQWVAEDCCNAIMQRTDTMMKKNGHPYIIIAMMCFLAVQVAVGCDRPDENQKEATSQDSGKKWYLPGMPGMWVKDPRHKGQPDQEKLEKLGALGYLSGYEKAPVHSGVTKQVTGKAYPGYNLWVSGHKAEAVLMDMDGAKKYEWSYDYNSIKAPKKESKNFLAEHNKKHWRGVHIFENGDLIAIYDYLGIIKIDKFSNMLWYYPGIAHHDLDITEDGRICALTAEVRMIPRLNDKLPIAEESICILDQDGNELQKISIIECFEKSPFSLVVREAAKKGGDIFHTNSVVVYEKAFPHKEFNIHKGDVLISIRNLSALAVIDLEKQMVKFYIQGIWKYQHEPKIQPDGNILLFDNSGFNSNSRIVEFNPFEKKIVWNYTGNPPDSFRSDYCGFVQRLDNGNTLITETCAGRAFEVTNREKEIVWEFFNPNRAGEHSELIAALFEVTRIRPDFPMDWMEKQGFPDENTD